MTAHKTKLGKLKYGHRPYEIILSIHINATKMTAEITKDKVQAIATAIELGAGFGYEMHESPEVTLLDIKELRDYFKKDGGSLAEVWEKQYRQQVGLEPKQ